MPYTIIYSFESANIKAQIIPMCVVNSGDWPSVYLVFPGMKTAQTINTSLSMAEEDLLWVHYNKVMKLYSV